MEISIRKMTDMDYDIAGNLLNSENADARLAKAFDDIELIKFASNIIVDMVFVNLFNPIQTVYKYALQACNDSKFVLYITALVNVGVLLLMCILTFIFKIGILGVFLSLLANYLILMCIYAFRYKKHLANGEGLFACGMEK